MTTNSRDFFQEETGRQPHRVVVLVYDGLAMLEFGAAIDIFAGHAEADEPWYQVELASADSPKVHTKAGALLQVAGDLSALNDADTVLIPGWRDFNSKPNATLITALCQAHQQGARLVSFCSGAFLLAHCGLLDNRAATTHWRYASMLAQLFPQVLLQSGELYTEQDNIWTSAGSAACLDLSLQLIARDFGAARANQSARRLVIPGVRDGGQQQFIELPLPSTRHPIGQVQQYALAHLAAPLSVEQLAAQAHMSRRSFDRHFKAYCGLSPKQWLLQARIAHGKTLLSSTTLPLEPIAAACGFSSAAAFRDQFVLLNGISPQRFRRYQLSI